jgi:hypothetical protein
MPFKPGESGNPAGNAKIKRFYTALDRAILQEDGKRLRAAAEKLLTLAAEGEQWAVQMLADRLDGKAAQSLTVSGDPENPLTVTELVRKVIE